MKARVDQAVPVTSPKQVPRTGKRLLVLKAAVWGGSADSFLAYCTDGDVAYRYQGVGSFESFVTELGANVERIATWPDMHGAMIAPCDVVIRPPPIPCAQTIQAAFDAGFLSIAA
jgi:hypothetical protein